MKILFGNLINLSNLVAIVLGITLGKSLFTIRHDDPYRIPAEAYSSSHNVYANLPAPSPEEFNALSGRVELKWNPQGELSDPNSQRGKMARALKLLDSLKIPDLPRDWKGGAREALENSIYYVASMTEGIQFDPNPNSAIAYNYKRSVSVSELFFGNPPLDAIITLVHESRHSSPRDPGHTDCKAGDIANRAGACDEWFRTDAEAGAYAYEVSYQLGLAKYASSLSLGDREYLRSNALSTLARRFNKVPEFLALPIETLIVLDASGRLFRIHPILRTAQPLAQTPLKGRITRLHFDRGTNGIFLFSDRDQFALMSSKYQYSIPHSERYPPPEGVLDLARLTFSNSSSNLYYIDAQHRIWDTDFKPDQKKYIRQKSGYQDPNLRLTRLMNGKKYIRYSWNDQGHLYYFDNDSGEIRYSANQDPNNGGWSDLVSNVVFDDVFGINSYGVLYYWTSDTSLKKSIFQTPPSVQYIETSNLRFLLSKTGNIYVRGQSGNKMSVLEGPKNAPDRWVSMAYVRTYVADDHFKVPKKLTSNFSKECDIVFPMIDPWTQRGMGLNRNGRLVFQGNTQPPCLNSAYQITTSAPQTISFSGSKPEKEWNSFSQIRLTLGGDAHIIPYLTEGW